MATVEVRAVEAEVAVGEALQVEGAAVEEGKVVIRVMGTMGAALRTAAQAVVAAPGVARQRLRVVLVEAVMYQIVVGKVPAVRVIVQW